jgi:hypothetical protein
MAQQTLFSSKRTTATVTVRCSGCSATATVLASRDWWPAMPVDWVACGTAENGGLAVWCGQCSWEGRHEARPS